MMRECDLFHLVLNVADGLTLSLWIKRHSERLGITEPTAPVPYCHADHRDLTG